MNAARTVTAADPLALATSDHFDAINLQLIAAVGELRMAALCLPKDAAQTEAVRRHLLAAERRIIEAHKAASEGASKAFHSA